MTQIFPMLKRSVLDVFLLDTLLKLLHYFVLMLLNTDTVLSVLSLCFYFSSLTYWTSFKLQCNLEWKWWKWEFFSSYRSQKGLTLKYDVYSSFEYLLADKGCLFYSECVKNCYHQWFFPIKCVISSAVFGMVLRIFSFNLLI